MWHDLGWGGVLRGKAHMSGVGLLPAQPLCRLGMPMCLGQRAMANLFRRRCWSCTEPYGPCGRIRLPQDPFLHLRSDGNTGTAWANPDSETINCH
jgi:hypothetical protein